MIAFTRLLASTERRSKYQIIELEVQFAELQAFDIVKQTRCVRWLEPGRVPA